MLSHMGSLSHTKGQQGYSHSNGACQGSKQAEHHLHGIWEDTQLQSQMLSHLAQIVSSLRVQQQQQGAQASKADTGTVLSSCQRHNTNPEKHKTTSAGTRLGRVPSTGVPFEPFYPLKNSKPTVFDYLSAVKLLHAALDTCKAAGIRFPADAT